MIEDPGENEESQEKSFAEILSEFESTTREAPPKASRGKGKNKNRANARPRLRGVVVSVSADSVLIDYGAKAEGVIPAADLIDPEGNLTVRKGDTFDVAVTGYNSEGMATLSRVAGPRPRDWDELAQAFKSGEVVAGRVTGSTRGGLIVDMGTRAFMPASRTGVRDPADLEKLVGQEVRCRIIKLDIDEEDVVVDRRSVLEEEADQIRRNTLEALQEGDEVRGTVRSIASYGAFLDIGGIDGLLHVGDIAWTRVSDPSTELAPGDVLTVKVLKVDKQSGKVSLGLKQMSPDPWTEAVARLNPGDRVIGEVTRLTDFGAFVEVMPGVEGLIHVSEMSWTKRIHRPDEVLKKGQRVEAVVLKMDSASSRLSLGLKQVLENPWDTIKQRYPDGKVVQGTVTRLARFGAFVEIEEGVEGLVHISELTGERRVQSASEVVKTGQSVQAVVLSVDPEARRLKLSMKQLEATPADLLFQELAVGDHVTGRVLEVRSNEVRVQLGEGVDGICWLPHEEPQSRSSASSASLAEQLAAAWKGGVKSPAASAIEPYHQGQLRSFRIKTIDKAGKRIELEAT